MTTTTNHRSYLNDVAPELVEVLANPEDDTPRLIYADWLEEHGEEERAEFIRRQLNGSLIEIVLGPGDSFSMGEQEVARGPHWLNGKGELPNGKFLVRRGFIAEIHAPIAVLMQHLPQLVREHPLEVWVTDREPEEFTDSVSWWMEVERNPQRYNNRCGFLPRVLWDSLSGFTEVGMGIVNHHKDYPTAEAAHAALSVALLEWAKGQRVEVNQ